METGKVKFFNESKGFGFITPDKGGADIFVHISNVEGKQNLKEKQGVSYETAEGKKGPQATNVKTV